MIKVGIYGATGYTGYELLKIFARHPQVDLTFVSSRTYAGAMYSDVYPCPYTYTLVAPDEVPLEDADVVFLCTPHGASAPYAQRVLEAGARCVDLSADFRLRDLDVYETWYTRHPAPELIDEAVYGLTEVYRDEVAGARLVANPGCYPTGPLLALYPLLQGGVVAGDRVIIDAKSGVSGAGAKPSLTTHFVNVHDNLSAYKLGRAHRHVPEIDQEMARYGQGAPRAIFAPHLLPVSRGILSTIYVQLDVDVEKAREVWHTAYDGEPFVQILDGDNTATLAHVVHTNRCALSITPAGMEGQFIIITALDNLLKGASGQAVQNMNVMFDLPETLGLES
ncbi:MAG: N-acetyl-gamma-glutamyl-phosphate reductase [Chloroflexota bacterium]|nr:N-acetyl-gamma-glutamyl-phosphate reductase [Chloroflexota bacterium]